MIAVYAQPQPDDRVNRGFEPVFSSSSVLPLMVNHMSVGGTAWTGLVLLTSG